MKFSTCTVASILAAMLLATGCASTVSGEPKTPSSENVISEQAILSHPVCTAKGAAARTAFFLTISGGGSRAAFFGARVLSELKDVDGDDLASHINAISSVSGGSMAASLYGISKDADQGDAWRPVWSDELIRKRLTSNLKASMAEQLANPVFLGGYIFGNKNRTDALFAALDADVLGRSGTGQPLTMGDLSSKRPQVIINSTVATKDESSAFRPRPFGSLFTFSPTDLDSIGVDYAGLPLSRAVAASAAFPGLLSPVVLHRFSLGATEQERGEAKYIHLMDGGNVDNLGLLAVKRALVEDSHQLLSDCDQVVVLTVDAFGSQGYHRDDAPSMRSVSGLVMDGNTLLSAFDALLAANRTRLLAEFKSRTFTPPADSAQCRKDGLSQVCGGGVRVNWNEVNTLLKEKLLFVHLSFNSNEAERPQDWVRKCRGLYGPNKPAMDCNNPPIDRHMYKNELRALQSRLKRIPTTFGLTRDEIGDITTFVRLLFLPQNECLRHMRGMLTGKTLHSAAFYVKAPSSCDETSSFTDEHLSRTRSRSEIFGDRSRSGGSPFKKISQEELPREKSLQTVDEREFFWSQVFKLYGWPGSENKR